MTNPSPIKSNKGIPTTQLAEPQENLSQDQFLGHLLHLEPKDVNLKFVFDHIRNYGICGAMLWVGAKVLAQAHKSPDAFSAFTELLAGSTLFALPWALFALNFAHGLVAVSKVQNVGRISKVLYIAVSLLLFSAAGKLMLFAKGL